MNTLPLTYNGHSFSFQYPSDAAVLESPHPDGTFLVRVLCKRENVKYRYEIEPLNRAEPAKKLAEIYFDHEFHQPEDIAPESVVINKLEGWHTRKVFIDGLKAILIYDAIFVNMGQSVYRFQYIALPREFEAGLRDFQTIVNSFTNLAVVEDG